MRIHGWGGYPTIDARVIEPISASVCRGHLDVPLIPRGMGRSYGDSANAPVVLQTTYLDHFLAFDRTSGVVTVEAGVTICELLKVIVPAGWFVPVTPGTSYVTVGGAIASDVHGKNHHLSGTFGQHVRSMRLMLGTGEVVTTSPTQLPDLFRATCGGMGLTGVVLDATIQLIPVKSNAIVQTTIKTSCLEEACEVFRQHGQTTYSVAWIDCLATGKATGRSVVMTGEHAGSGSLTCDAREPLSVPVYAPAGLLNRASVSAFNALYYHKAAHKQTRTVPMAPYFYPLDAIGGWNRLYGRAGFVQYQFVVPVTDGVAAMRAILGKIAESGAGSFLAVLKQFGPGNDHLLSFPMSGYTLALDLRMSACTAALLRTLDDMVAAAGGRIYLTKDALMSERIFKATYPRWQEFEAAREKYGAIGKFASSQSKRLGLA